MKSYNPILRRLTTLVLIVTATFSFPHIIYAQSNDELNAQQIFEEIVNYYDPNETWDTLKGKLQHTSLMNGKLTTQEILIDNKNNIYECIRNREDGVFIKGVKNGNSFFTINGKAYNADEIPEKYQKYPYSLSEYYAQVYEEHHTFHFSMPLALKKAGAIPVEGVGKKYLFGKACHSIKFKEYPNHFEGGYYGIPMTIYVIPEEKYRIHAVHLDNGWGDAKEGLIILFDGEIEVGEIKVPASKLTFFAASLKFLIVDTFENMSE
ncbi:MAG: DUF6503 family protein [Bacteroidota bacterium]